MSHKLDEITGHKLAGLNMDLLGKLREGIISIPEFEGFLSMPAEERRRIFGIAPKIEKNLAFRQNITIPACTEHFVPDEKFNKNKKVKYWKGDNFIKYLLDATSPFDSVAEATLAQSTLKKQTTDKDIMSLIGVTQTEGLLTKEEILWRISYLTEQQPKGEEGALLVNGYATIIGYFRCSDGAVRVANVGWRSGDRVWRCFVSDLGGTWGAGDEVLSSNNPLES